LFSTDDRQVEDFSCSQHSVRIFDNLVEVLDGRTELLLHVAKEEGGVLGDKLPKFGQVTRHFNTRNSNKTKEMIPDQLQLIEVN
jgi:hypothetical protein